MPECGENLIAAERCFSAEHEALASARVMAQCSAYGHAAGLAAVVSLEQGRAMRAIDGTGRAVLGFMGWRCRRVA